MTTRLSAAQKKLITALSIERRAAVAKELKIFGLRAAIGLHRDFAYVDAYSLGLKRVDSRSLRALAKEGLIELKEKKHHDVHRWVSVFTREACFTNQYYTSYYARVTPVGHAFRSPNKAL